MLRAFYTCPFVPSEWVEAHGVRACRAISEVKTCTAALPETGVCPYARSYAQQVLLLDDAAVAVFTTRCDQMRRLFDMVSSKRRGPTFLLNVPATWRTPAAQELYASELERLGRFLQALGGHALDCRHLLRAQAGESHVDGARSGASGNGLVRLGVIGGPLAGCEFGDQVLLAGACVVLDATESSEHMRAALVDRDRLMQDPAREMARAYLAMPSIHQRPDGRWLEWLKRAVADFGVHGLVLRRYVWCDLWHAQAQRIVDAAGVPVLDLQVEAGVQAARTRGVNRIGAFVEMLRGQLSLSAS